MFVMIRVDKITVHNIDGAIRGMRNPMNSWSKSDSHYESGYYVVGDADMELMKKLYKAGNEHRKYLRQIFVCVDITAPLYWISEFDTYKVGTTRNSCSFMHKGVSKPFDIQDFSIHDDRVYNILSPLKEKTYDLIYPYETEEYREYTCENGRVYEIYKNGRVFSKEFCHEDSIGRKRYFKRRECKPSRNSNSQYEINIGGRNGEKWMLHRLVATAWIDNVNKLKTVNHIDGNKGNNSVENLEWMSLQDNIKNGFENGLYDRGKTLHTDYIKWRNAHVVIDPLTKNQIIHDYNSGLTYNDIEEKYQVKKEYLYNLLYSRKNENEDLFLLCYSWEQILSRLNYLRDVYLDTKDNEIFQQIRCLLPCGYNQTFTVTMNYENVMNIINQRTGHKLDEWNEFVGILKDLPYIKEIRGENDEERQN